MAFNRHFLGWQRPAILAFRDYLMEAREEGQSIDQWLILVPSARAGRHLLSQMFSGDGEREAFHPPEMLTPAQFIHSLNPGKSMANPSQRIYAWKTALQSMDSGLIHAAFPQIPERNKFSWAYATADQLMDLRERLVEENKTIAEVSTADLGMDRDRWIALAELEKAYLRQLNKLGLVDPDEAFREAFPKQLEGFPYNRLLLACILNLSHRQMMAVNAVSALDIPVDCFIPAPESKSKCFTESGSPVADYWLKESVPDALIRDKIHRTSEPRECVSSILQLADLYHEDIDSLVVGSPDETNGRILIEQSRLKGIPFYAPQGRSLAETSWGKLIQLVLKIQTGAPVETWLELIRHAYFRRWMEKLDLPADSIERSLLKLRKEHLFISLSQLDDSCLGPSSAIARVREFLGKVLPVLQPADKGATLPDIIWMLMQSVKGSRSLDAGENSIFSRIKDLLLVLKESLPEKQVAPDDMVMLLRQLLKDTIVYPERDSRERPVTGWLELPWEVSPHLVVFGLPDDVVPGPKSRDPFVTPALCRKLGFYSHEDEAAFDAFRLHLILESRSEWGRLDILLPDRGLDDSPARPCRFLFASGEEEICDRIQWLLNDLPVNEVALPAQFGASIQLPAALPLASISVTSFRSYLNDPFLFYLQNRLRWEPPGALPMELDARMFGNLVHRVMECLNKDPDALMLTEPDVISDYMQSVVDQEVSAVFGSKWSVPLQVQVGSMRERLRFAAAVISEERRKGWVPIKVEWAFHKEHPFEIDGVALHGKIDLVERNEESGKYRILDYKTSDKNDGPLRAHLKQVRGNSPDPFVPQSDFMIADKAYRWIDLQLPLYQLASIKLTGEPADCGYLCLGKAVNEIQLSEWTPDELQSAAALNCARAILRRVMDNDFPLAARPSAFNTWVDWLGGQVENAVMPAGNSEKWRQPGES